MEWILIFTHQKIFHFVVFLKKKVFVFTILSNVYGAVVYLLFFG